MADISALFAKIWLRRYAFVGVFFVVVFVTYSVLYALDFYPEPVGEGEETAAAVTGTDDVAEGDEATALPPVDDAPTPPPVTAAAATPTEIIFDSLDNRTIAVNNPTSRAIPDLDEALLTGAVRHPDSADFQDEGNIFILGHSSYLPSVINKNFQAFNGIQNLEWGDTIRLRSVDREYVYRVDRVFEAKASDVVVPNSRGEAKLTLATCDSFGSKDDRFIVEASLIDEYPITG